MSVNSGIQPTAALAKEFEESNRFESTVRCLKVEIIDEQLRSTQCTDISGDENEDYKNLYKVLSNNIPAFLLFKQDNKKFRIIHYAPESASIKLKMIYSSSRASLEKQLGSQFFIKTDFIDDIKQFSEDADAPTHPFKVIQEADKPYSEKERQLNEIDDLIKSSGSLSKVTQSIKFNWNEDVTQALNEIVNNEHNFVQCGIDMKTETIILESKKNVELVNVRDNISTDEPRYTLYKMKGGDYIFIYTCPPTSNIKSRMLYSSSATNFPSSIQSTFTIVIKKKLETNDPAELSDVHINAELNPTKASTITEEIKFSKPRGPANRRRVIYN